MNYEQMLVTPEMASEWLKYNTNNRTIAKRATDAIVADIHAGDWKTTHQGIAFTGSRQKPGRLLDGQKRLTAIVRAGKPVLMYVAWHVAEDTFSAIDSVQPRQNWFNANLDRLVGLAITAIIGSVHASVSRRVTAAELRRLDAIVGDSVRWVIDRTPRGNKHATMTCRRGPVLAVFARAHFCLTSAGCDVERLEHFIHVFNAQQVASVRDNAILDVRRKIDNIPCGGQGGRQETACKLERALVAYLNGAQIPNVLKCVDEEQFPIGTIGE